MGENANRDVSIYTPMQTTFFKIDNLLLKYRYLYFNAMEKFNTHEACSEIIETFAFYPEQTDLDKQNSAWIIIDLLINKLFCYIIWR